MKALIRITDINNEELAHLYTEGESPNDIFTTANLLLGYISDLPNLYDVHIEFNGDE